MQWASDFFTIIVPMVIYPLCLPVGLAVALWHRFPLWWQRLIIVVGSELLAWGGVLALGIPFLVGDPFNEGDYPWEIYYLVYGYGLAVIGGVFLAWLIWHYQPFRMEGWRNHLANALIWCAFAPFGCATFMVLLIMMDKLHIPTGWLIPGQ